MKGRSKTFYRYVLSYALVLFLPVLILFLVLYSYVTGQFSKEITQRSSAMLSQVQESFDAQLEQLIHIAYMIQNDSSLKRGTVENDVIAGRKAVATLSNYNSITTLPETIWLYHSGSGVVYTSSTVISLEKLFQQQYKYTAHSQEDFLQTVDAAPGIISWGADSVTQFGGQVRDYITLFIAVQSGNIVPKTRTVYSIPVDALRVLLKGITQDYESNVLILDSAQQVIMTTDAAQDLQNMYAAQVQHSKTKLIRRLSYENQDYYVSEVTSKIVGWTYVIVTPVRVIEEPLRQVRLYTLLALLCICLLGGAAIYWISTYNYRPLRRLTQQASAYVAVQPGENEMDTVSNALEHLSRSSDEYRSTLDNNRHALLQSRLAQLLQGHVQKIPAFLQEMQKLGVTLNPDASYVVIILYIKPGDFAPRPEVVTTALQSASLGFEEALTYHNRANEAVYTALLPLDAEGFATLDEQLYAIQDYLQTALDTQVAMAVSLPVALEGISTAHEQAAKALNLRLVRGGSSIIFYDPDMEETQTLRHYPQQELERLQGHLLQLDTKGTSQCIYEIMQSIERQNMPFSAARLVCFDVMNTTIRCLYSVADHTMAHMPSDLMERLIGFDTTEELTTLLEELVQQSTQSIQALRQQKTDDRLARIKQYIETAYGDPNFSLYTVADHFGLISSNLSHYFRNATGQSVSDYVQLLRKAEACQLLTETELSIQAIGEKIGMMNVSSFIRNFKQQTGMTPGQYREEARRE